MTNWPDPPEIVERIPLISCTRRGAAIDVVADRDREHRSEIVFTRGHGREMVFWQSPRTRKPGPTFDWPLPEPPASSSWRSWSTPRAWAETETAALQRIGLTAKTQAESVLDENTTAAPSAPSAAEIRAWPRANGMTVPDRGRLRPEIR